MVTVNIKEKAVEYLLKSPAIQYVRSIEKLTQADPDYVNSNREDVGNIVGGFLAGGGFHWDAEIFEKEWPDILQEAMARLGGKKAV